MSTDFSYYGILGVARNASASEIDAAYQRYSLKYHPDENDAPNAPRVMQIINEAHRVLSDPAHRGEYDKALDSGADVRPPFLRRLAEYASGNPGSAEELSALNREAIAWVEIAANKDIETPPDSFSKLGEAERSAIDERESLDRAAAAAQRGVAAAQYDLGKAYSEGGCVEQDHVRAAFWFQQAANQGHGSAQFCFGIALLDGVGVERNQEAGVMLIRSAAKNRCADAQEHLALLFEYGFGDYVEQDASRARWLYRKAAEGGLCSAQVSISAEVEDRIEAAYWTGKAAEQGDAASRSVLSMAYSVGDGVPLNEDRANYWWRRSKEKSRTSKVSQWKYPGSK